jgi:hypothetical protein
MPRSLRHSRSARQLAVLIAVACVALAASPLPARAGTYTVAGTCGLWDPFDTGGSGITLYATCPSLWARNVGGNFATGAGGHAGWVFYAPAGTTINGFYLQGPMTGTRGWQATGYLEGGGWSAGVFENCPGSTCPGAYKYLRGSYSANGATGIVMRLRCGASCPNNEGITGYFTILEASVTLADPSPPGVALAGGSLLAGGWKSATHTLVVDANDNSGIQEYRASLDGAMARRVPIACNYGLKVPCPNGSQPLDVSIAGLKDGVHTVTAEAVDASGNANQASTTIYVDNTPPTQPLDFAVAGGAGWRSTDTIGVSWKNPAQSFAPIAGAGYQLCPALPSDATAELRAKAQTKCVQGSRSGANLDAIKDLKLPAPGAWDLRLWLIDAAGNQQAASAAAADGLAFDDTPPADVAFLTPDPQDPARVHVQARDEVSGVAAGAIEVRRDGDTAWQPLPTQPEATGLTGVVDDETLPNGLYFLRARAVNRAGLETSTDRDASGLTAMLKLPVRLASRLTAGRRGKRTCHGTGRRRHCRYRLATKPAVRIGRATRLYGRLTVAGRSMPGTPVQVWRRLELDGASWAQIATVTTSRTGRFSYRARRGPARAIRFRYPGTPTIRGRNGDVALRVRASTTLRPNRHTVINGEYVTFRGRLKGGWIPPAGTLVELQVYSRGQWRTFAQPRARTASGRWAYRYRFETVRGRATFRFRARIRRQPDYPFTTGASRAVRVKVRGL